MKFNKIWRKKLLVTFHFFNMSMINYMLSWFEHESGPGWTFCLNCLQGVKLHGRGFHLKPWNVWSLWWYSVADPEGLARPPLRSPAFKYHLNVFFIETKLFRFHRIFNKNEIKSAKQTPSLKSLYILASFPESLDLHLQVLHILHIKPFEQDLTVTKFSECKILGSRTKHPATKHPMPFFDTPTKHPTKICHPGQNIPCCFCHPGHNIPCCFCHPGHNIPCHFRHSGVTKTAWDVLSGDGKSMRDVLSGVAKNDMGCFVRGCFVLHSNSCKVWPDFCFMDSLILVNIIC